MPIRFLFVCLLFCVAAVAGCGHGKGPQVVVYASADAEFSEPLLADFAREAHAKVLPKFDAESTKTVGLYAALVAESARPRADVFWNNEILNTLRLEQQGLLDVYRSPQDDNYPPEFRSSSGTWHGFAGRARVLLVNKDLVPPDQRPRSIQDLASPTWQGKIAMAKPLFGTTATHAACLFAVWGDDTAREYYRKLKANGVQILSGNKQVAEAVSAGQIAFGITDTDDALIEVEKGHPVEIVYPDREINELGTLFIPNTLAILKGCPHPQEARKLVDYLLQPAVEDRLASGPGGHIPLSLKSQAKTRVETPATVKPLAVDFLTAVDKWETASNFLRDEFATGN